MSNHQRFMGQSDHLMMVHLSLTARDIFNTIAQYQYAIIIPITALEGPVAVFMTGFLVSLGFLNLFIAFGTVMAGNLAGDFMFYAIGKWGRGPLGKGWGKVVGITPKNSEQMRKYFTKHSARTIILGKLTHVFGASALIAAGLDDYPLPLFFLYGILAGVPKMIALMSLGYFYGDIYDTFGVYFTILALASIVLLPASFWWFSLEEKIRKIISS